MPKTLSLLSQIDWDSLLAKLRLDKAVELYHQATPTPIRYQDIRVFRASMLHNLCPVEAAYAVKLMKAGKKGAALEWAQGRVLPPHIMPIVDTGTVVHKQLQYYAGLVGFVRHGRWVCPACGWISHPNVPMPLVDLKDPVGGSEHEYPAPCPRCAKNLGHFPPWLYSEPTLTEKVKGVPVKFRVTGHVDGIWTIRVTIKKKVHWVKIVVDYKTINKAGFEGAYGGGLPKADHIYQLQVYLNLSNIDVGLLIYYCKDNSKQKYCLVKRDPKLWLKVQKKVAWARAGKMAQREKHRVCDRVGHPRARDCYFAEQCWSGKKPKDNWMA